MDFDRVAGVYRILERLVYGGALQRARVAHLDFSGTPRILILGDGDGRCLECLLERVPGANIDFVEASAKMIELARRRVPAGAAVVFHQRLVEEFVPSGRYDAVVSHFFLDCFGADDIAAIARMVAGCLQDDGIWLVSDFQRPPTGWLRRLRARILLWTMYRFFGFAVGLGARELVDPDQILGRAGFVIDDRVVSNLGFVRADRWRIA